jgi:hypothetical protein
LKVVSNCLLLTPRQEWIVTAAKLQEQQQQQQQQANSYLPYSAYTLAIF